MNLQLIDTVESVVVRLFSLFQVDAIRSTFMYQCDVPKNNNSTRVGGGPVWPGLFWSNNILTLYTYDGQNGPIYSKYICIGAFCRLGSITLLLYSAIRYCIYWPSVGSVRPSISILQYCTGQNVLFANTHTA